ncbi:MAG TPA: hypothetical protein VMI94_24400 [Bryobacteraceae bacterium]|nr:hypothetical protein [Bryobacteraceae bacterium]
MSCSPFDLRDYFFKELNENERRLTEVHVRTCAACREELERLRGTEAALLSLRDEEIPQRIGFVSDPVFQPSALSRGWNAFWGSAARLGFASAAMLSIALVVFALTRPAPQANAPTPGLERAALEANFSRQLSDAVAKAVAASEARTQALLSASEKQHELDIQAMQVRFDQYVEVERKHRNALILASAGDPSKDAR